MASQQQILAAIPAPVSGGYTDTIDPADTTNDQDIPSGAFAWMPISPSTTISKLGFYAAAVLANAIIHMAVYDAMGVRLAAADVNFIGGSPGFADADCTPVSGAAFIGFIGDAASSTFVTGRYAGVGVLHFNGSIFSACPANLPSDDGPATLTFSARYFSP